MSFLLVNTNEQFTLENLKESLYIKNSLGQYLSSG